jgi:hypothetical protein
MTLYSTVSDVFAEVGCISVDESDLIVVMLFVATARGFTPMRGRLVRRIHGWPGECASGWLEGARSITDVSRLMPEGRITCLYGGLLSSDRRRILKGS